MWRVSDRAPSFRLGRAHSALRARQGLDSPVCFHMPLPVNLIRSFYGTDRAQDLVTRFDRLLLAGRQGVGLRSMLGLGTSARDQPGRMTVNDLH
jgi:hypothetical protein